MEEGPSRRYFGSLLGRWAGDFTLSVTDPKALAGLALHVRAVALFARFDGRLRMVTTLAERDRRTFHHTTRLTRWGALVLSTEETITLDADGRRLRMAGEQRPRFAAVVPYAGDGEVAPEGDAVTYEISWAGMPLTQRTRIVHEGLLLTQHTAWSKASVLLRREASTAAGR